MNEFRPCKPWLLSARGGTQLELDASRLIMQCRVISLLTNCRVGGSLTLYSSYSILLIKALLTIRKGRNIAHTLVAHISTFSPYTLLVDLPHWQIHIKLSLQLIPTLDTHDNDSTSRQTIPATMLKQLWISNVRWAIAFCVAAVMQINISSVERYSHASDRLTNSLRPII